MKEASYAPVYCALYPQLAEIIKEYGYATAPHGSLARDFDIVCIPWTGEAQAPEKIIERLVDVFAWVEIGEPEVRQHGRKIWTLAVGFGECFIDISFMPRESDWEQRQQEYLNKHAGEK